MSCLTTECDAQSTNARPAQSRHCHMTSSHLKNNAQPAESDTEGPVALRETLQCTETSASRNLLFFFFRDGSCIFARSDVHGLET